MPGQMQANARWWLDEPLDLSWRDKAVCKSRQDLPWTGDSEPDSVSKVQMYALCDGCPVRGPCADFGLKQPGGWYAGVWVPWNDGSDSSRSETWRSERALSKNALRRVCDSATPELTSTPEDVDEFF